MFKFAVVGFFFSVAAAAASPTARVLIDKETSPTLIQGQFTVQCLSRGAGGPWREGPCSKADPRNAARKISVGAGHFSLHVRSGALTLSLAHGRKFQTIYSEGVRFKGNFKWQKVSMDQLDLYLHRDLSGWVAHLPLETYLLGVVSSEVPASWPLAALKAQAIASRTYFMYKKNQNEGVYDVRSDHMDQVFKLTSDVADNIAKAVNETKGVVLANGTAQEIFPTYFHSDCGGHTSSEASVWRKPAASNRPVKDEVCQRASRNAWQLQLSNEDLLALLQEKFILPRDVRLQGIFPRAGGEKRAHTIDFLFSNNLLKTMNANEFRSLIGFGKMKSTQFMVTATLDGYTFSGRGYGHGVGMCQWGAQRWALQGKSYEEILRHYYPQATLSTLDKAPLSVAGGGAE